MARLWTIETESRTQLQRWTAVWDQTANSAVGWRVYRLARFLGEPVPASVMGEFDRIADGFQAEIEGLRDFRGAPSRRGRPPGLRSETVGRIVTRSGRGASDPASVLLAWERDFNLAAAVAILRGRGESEAVAAEIVAAGTKDLIQSVTFEAGRGRLHPTETPPVSIDVVRRAVRRVRRLLPDSDG